MELIPDLLTFFSVEQCERRRIRVCMISMRSDLTLHLFELSYSSADITTAAQDLLKEYEFRFHVYRRAALNTENTVS